MREGLRGSAVRAQTAAGGTWGIASDTYSMVCLRFSVLDGVPKPV